MMGRLQMVLLPALLWACAEPARSQLRTPEPPQEAHQILTEECGGLRVQLTLERKPRNAPVYTVSVTDLSGQPLTSDARVILAFTSVGEAIGTTTAVARPIGGGHYAFTGGFALTPGPWQVEAIVRRANAAEVTCVFSFNL